MGTSTPPIAALLPAILEKLAAQTRLVLEAPTGAGKTTAVPPALLDCDWLAGQRIVVLEPRRLAARAAAGFMAAQRDEKVGATVGYRIRFDNLTSAATRIEVVTEGIFTRMIQSDPGLEGIGAVLFDEFHERHLAADLGLALALDVQAALRPDLRLVLMSATLDGEALADWLDCPRLRSAGRSFPVDIRHPPARRQASPLMQLASVVPQALAERDGDMLVFLPGQREIARAERLLTERIRDPDVVLLALHGNLSLERQRAALRPAEPGTRHVILATNVAESSVTLPGIRTVVDLGQAREPRFDPNSGLTRLQTVAISQASADQRAGRAGRVAPGCCLRLWPESQRLESARRAEIEHADLTALALELAAWGSSELDWLTPPPAGALAGARDLLVRLGALDTDQRITRLGRRMLATGATPRLAAAICAAEPGELGLIADLLALLESRSPLRGTGGTDDDLRRRLDALHAWRDRGGRGKQQHDADRGALARIDQLARGWRRRLKTRQRPSGTQGPLAVGNLLLPAFPDRVAQRDPGNELRCKLANGRGSRLHEESALRGEPWLVALEVQDQRGDSYLRLAAPFDPERLTQVFPAGFHNRTRQEWNAQARRVEGYAERCFGQLVLERKRVALSDNERQHALLEAVRNEGLQALPWDCTTRSLCQRARCIRTAMPESTLPSCDEADLLATLQDWLGPWLAGRNSLDGLAANDLHDALQARMDHTRKQQLKQLAPERWQAPSGRRFRIDYRDPATPVLPIKLQELFGVARTPHIVGGRVALTVHLLSPAGRPVQVTRDLAHFWAETYAEVRKDLRGRYPKHAWPVDPAHPSG